jgi:hypothetical protein
MQMDDRAPKENKSWREKRNSGRSADCAQILHIHLSACWEKSECMHTHGAAAAVSYCLTASLFGAAFFVLDAWALCASSLHFLQAGFKTLGEFSPIVHLAHAT